MAGEVPSYLRSLVVERGDAKDELLLCLVDAVERQTDIQERIAVALERIVEAPETGVGAEDEIGTNAELLEACEEAHGTLTVIEAGFEVADTLETIELLRSVVATARGGEQ